MVWLQNFGKNQQALSEFITPFSHFPIFPYHYQIQCENAVAKAVSRMI